MGRAGRQHPPRYRVMAEYGSSGVWRIGNPAGPGPFRHGMVELVALGVPESLAERFVAWIERYEDENLSGALDHTSFNAEGLALAIALWRHLGSDIHVEFQGEADGGGMLAPEVVDASVDDAAAHR